MNQHHGARYGASLASILLAGYILGSVDFTMISGALRGGRALDASVPLFIAFVIMLAAIAIHPASVVRRTIAATVALLTLLSVLSFQLTWMMGIFVGSPLGPATYALTRWEGVTATALTASWLILQARAPLTYLLLAAGAFVPIASWALFVQGAPTPLTIYITMALSLAIAVGFAWAAAFFSRGIGRDAETRAPDVLASQGT